VFPTEDPKIRTCFRKVFTCATTGFLCITAIYLINKTGKCQQDKRKHVALCALPHDGERRGAELIVPSRPCWASSITRPLKRPAFPFAHILDGMLASSESRVRHGELLGETAADALKPQFLAPKRCTWSELAFRSQDRDRRDETRQKRLELFHPFP
jgi:hypothetical protein